MGALNMMNNIDYYLELVQTNEEDRNSIKEWNCFNTHHLLIALNSAPANLRYGDRSMNKGLAKECLDPMGNKEGVMTAKEKKLFRLCTMNGASKTNTYLINGKYYVMSSTGPMGHKFPRQQVNRY